MASNQTKLHKLCNRMLCTKKIKQTLDILYSIDIEQYEQDSEAQVIKSRHKTKPGQRPRNIAAVSALFFLAHGGY